MQPVRRPAKRRAASCTTGVLPLVDAGSDALAFEGRLDLDFQRIMAVAPHVQHYVEQPETFKLMIDGKARRYTPDGLAYTSFGRIYFEVKPLLQLERSPDLNGRLASIISECTKRRAGFNIVTESDIRVGKLLGNSTAVWSAAQAIEVGEAQRVCRLLRAVSFPVTMSDLREHLGPRHWFLVKALIGLRYLATDLSRPFSDATVLSRGGRDW